MNTFYRISDFLAVQESENLVGISAEQLVLNLVAKIGVDRPKSGQSNVVILPAILFQATLVGGNATHHLINVTPHLDNHCHS